MLSLVRIGSLAALLLVCCSCQRLQPLTDFGRSLTSAFTGNTPIRAVARMEDRYFPDERRIGINRLSSQPFGRRPPYIERYHEIAQYDSDYLVRATAIRALNRSRDRAATSVFVKALEDPHPLVRQEAAKALANVPDPASAPQLTRLMTSPQEPRDVRIAAADALRHYRTLEVARTLVDALDNREFSVAWQARRSLVRMTGRDLHYNEPGWLEFLTGPQRPFS